jgi:hypothetical protein
MTTIRDSWLLTGAVDQRSATEAAALVTEAERNRREGFYAWSAHDSDSRGSCGVTGEPERAARRLHDALKDLGPGAQGKICRVRLDTSSRRPQYVYGKVMLRIRWDRRGGGFVIG